MPKQAAPNDFLGQVLGKEHSGRMRGMGAGVVPSETFGSSSSRYVGESSNADFGSEQILWSKLQQSLEKNKRYEEWSVKIFQHMNVPIPLELAMLEEQVSCYFECKNL
ncbi:unnamed protein product [Linum tenue]|uniref:Uncharacterized protein n=1 Tax=Linum tenue TaxID=586396 RepID=A0AAV0I393_9ROSI|nr:unnamed protein product [Linum tenue]